MTTINLHQSRPEDQSRFSMKKGNNGFVFSLGILFVTLVVLAALKFYVPFAEGKNKVLNDTVLVENNKLVGLKSLEQVVDMQKRLDEIKHNLQLRDGNVTRLKITESLDKLGGDLNTGIIVSGFKYDTGKVTISFDANNFSDVAKQILNFKKSEYFNEVELVSVSRQENTINCTVAMKIKK